GSSWGTDTALLLRAAGAPEAPAPLEEIVARLRAQDPGERYASARAAREALEKVRLTVRAAAASGKGWEDPAPRGYRFLTRIGEGSFAAVYEAFHEATASSVAVKVIRPVLEERPEMRERFIREAQLGARLVHPG